MKLRMGLLILFIVASLGIKAQLDFHRIEQKLAYHADVMINAEKAVHRMQSASTFDSLFSEALAQNGSFQYPFDSLVWITRIEPEDLSFRVFSWQVRGISDQTRYHGYLQLATGQVVPLKDNGGILPDGAFSVLTPANWFGQIYYDLHEQSFQGVKQYLLFGYRETPSGKRIKMVEPLQIQDGKVQFGLETFFDQGRHGAFRILIEYAGVASAQMAYDAGLDAIIFDHLIAVINPYESNEIMMVPDGTLEGYFFDNGKWMYKDKLPTENYDSAPVPEPVLKDRDKDLFGK